MHVPRVHPEAGSPKAHGIARCLASIVPEPMTRVDDTPEPAAKCAARCVMMSTGSETTTTIASPACCKRESHHLFKPRHVALEHLEPGLAGP
jgi:hypothetical protein